MAKFIKVILLLLFAVALHGVANNFFAEKPVETQEHAQVYKVDSQQVSTAQLPYLPEGELSTSLRALAQQLQQRDAALAQHWGRIYDTTTSFSCHPASEYYVFALRRIII